MPWPSARQLGKVCLVGCRDLVIDAERRQIRFGDRVLQEGEAITLDGNTGRIHAGVLQPVRRVPAALLARLERLRSAG
jgi:pyruvate, orthophosphate dikinase